MTDFFYWCQHNAFTQWILAVKWRYPSLEILHIAGLILVVGSMLILNLRIFNRILRAQPVSEVAGDVNRATWTGIVIQVLTGPVLFMATAMRFWENGSFQVKIFLLAVALTYHFGAHRRFALNPATSPGLLRVSAAFSMFLWVGVVLSGLSIELAN